MSRRHKSRIKKGVGMAFIRFLSGALVLGALCLLFYIFVLNGSFNFTVALPGVEPLPTVTSFVAQAPSATPAPLVDVVSGASPEVPGTLSEKLNVRAKTVKIGADDCLTLVGCAYIEGADASRTSLYLLAQNTDTGVFTACYQLPSNGRGETWAELAPDGGVNLNWAYFSVRVAIDGYPSGAYRLGILAVNGEDSEFNYIGDEPNHFSVAGGVIAFGG